jgi:hypothetical protein
MLSKDDIVQARNEALVKSIKREEQIKALDRYISFVTTKLVGLGSLTIATLEMLNPAFHPVKLVSPEALFAFGLALLVGPKIVTLLSKVVNALKE